MEQHNDPQGARVASAPMASGRHGIVGLIDCALGRHPADPALAIFSSTHVRDLGAASLLAATAVFFGLLRAILGLRAFLLLTYVPALFGVLAVGADLLRDVNLFEAALIRPDPHEAWPVIQPHVQWIAPGRGPARDADLGVVSQSVDRAGALEDAFGRPCDTHCRRSPCGAVFHETVLRAWPLNVISVAAASAIGRDDFISTASPYAAAEPSVGVRELGRLAVAGTSPAERDLHPHHRGNGACRPPRRMRRPGAGRHQP